MNEKILLEINRARTLMTLEEMLPDNFINEQISQVLKGVEKQIAGRWLSSIINEYINRLVNSAIKNAGKAIDPAQFVQRNLDNVIKFTQVKLGRVLTEAEKQTIEAGMRREMTTLVNNANKKAPTKLAKDAVKGAQKNIVDPLAQKSVQQGGKKTIGSGTKSTVNQEVKNAIESSVTSEVKSVGDAMKDLVKALAPKDGWKRIKEHFKRNYGKYITAAGVTALAVYFYFYGEDAEVPQDIEQYVEDTSGTGGGDSGIIPVEDGAYTTAGDPYQYKVIDGVWHTKGGRPPKVIQNWVSLANNTQAQDILDKRFPDARKKPTTTPEPNKPTPEAGKEEEVVASLDF